jgi:hypothetical protein
MTLPVLAEFIFQRTKNLHKTSILAFIKKKIVVSIAGVDLPQGFEDVLKDSLQDSYRHWGDFSFVIVLGRFEWFPLILLCVTSESSQSADNQV